MAYEDYDAAYRSGGRYRFDRDFERAYRLRYDRDYRGGGGAAPPARLGMHDFTERFGRYSGGPPDAYGYSERTILHGHPPYPGGIGFTRPLRRRPRRAGPAYGGEFGRFTGRAGTSRGRRGMRRARRPRRR